MHSSKMYVFFYYNLINKYSINVNSCCLGQGAVVARYEEASEISDFIEDEEIEELGNVILSEMFLLHGCNWLAR